VVDAVERVLNVPPPEKNRMTLGQAILVASEAAPVCCSGYGRIWIIGLTSPVSQRMDTYSNHEACKDKKKGKVSTLQVRCGPEGG